jgi:hypothetical protein
MMACKAGIFPMVVSTPCEKACRALKAHVAEPCIEFMHF